MSLSRTIADFGFFGPRTLQWRVESPFDSKRYALFAQGKLRVEGLGQPFDELMPRLRCKSHGMPFSELRAKDLVLDTPGAVGNARTPPPTPTYKEVQHRTRKGGGR